jgi:Peptidase family M48
MRILHKAFRASFPRSPGLRWYTPENKINFIALREKTPFKHNALAYGLFALVCAPAVLLASMREPVILTGRSRPMFVTAEDEKEMGEQAISQIPLYKALPSNDRRVKAVVEVSLRIADAVESLYDELEKDKPKAEAKGLPGGAAAMKILEKGKKDATSSAASTNAASAVGVALKTRSVLSNAFSMKAAETKDNDGQAHETSGSTDDHSPTEPSASPSPSPRGPWQKTPRSAIMRKLYKLLGYEQQRRFQWRVIVIEDDKVVNALCAPSGIVVVYTGLLNFIDKATEEGQLKNRESALATILAHEISHAVARHGAEKFSSGAPWMALLNILGSSSPLLPLLYELFYDRPNSREMEHEADTLGLHLMSRACYDTRAAAKFFLALQSSSGLAAYVSTHPADEDRAANCAALSAVLSLKQKAYCGDGSSAGKPKHDEAEEGSTADGKKDAYDDEDAYIVHDRRVERWLTGVNKEAEKRAERKLLEQLLQ